MEGEASIRPSELDENLVQQALSQQAEVIILPLKEVDGKGIYPESSLSLAKQLRAQGVNAVYLHPSERRSFELKKSAILAAGLTVVLGISSSAAWDGVKRLFESRQHPKLDVTFLELENRETCGRAWRAQGDADAVLQAIDRLRTSQGPAIATVESEISPGPAPPPEDFETAGSDEDLRVGNIEKQITARRAAAQECLGAAETLLAGDPIDWPEAERLARNALLLFARSLDWAEESEAEEEAHFIMDQAGTWVRSTFGCALARSDKTYKQTCPVALAHNRIGLSVGGSAFRICSLCGSDLSECDHQPGTAYLVPGGSADLGWCRVCLKDDCDHAPDERYRVSVVARVEKMDLEEVSLVYKPAQPEARITEMSVTTSDLQAEPGEQFVTGMEVSCDRCLKPCRGLVKHVDDE